MKTIGLIASNYISGDFERLEEKRTLASLPFGGRYRLIDFTLSNMVNAGIKTVGVITPYNSGSLIDHIGVGKPWKLDRKVGGMFLMPGSVYGISKKGSRFILRDVIDNKDFLLRDTADYVVVSSSSDVYSFDFNELIEAHAKSDNKVTLLVKKVDNAEELKGFFLTTDRNGKVTRLDDSATGEANYFMDAFIVDREYMIQFVDWFAKLEHLDMFDIIKDNLNMIDIGTYEFNGYFGKISSIQDYINVNLDILKEDVKNELFNPDRPIYTKIQDEAPTQFLPGAKVTNSFIAAGCKIAGRVENSVLFRSTNVEAGAIVSDSVVMMHGQVDEDAILINAICDKYVHVMPGTKLVGGYDKPLVVGKGKKA